MTEQWDESGGPYGLNAYMDETNTDEIMDGIKEKWRNNKMSKYKTLDEIFPGGKGDGRKFIFKVGAAESSFWFIPYFRTDAGKWHGLNEMGQLFTASNTTSVKEYTEPKKTKKVTMYNPIRKSPTKGEYWAAGVNSWNTRKENFHGDNIVGWIELEAEIEC